VAIAREITTLPE
jgi:IS30 family transposase